MKIPLLLWFPPKNPPQNLEADELALTWIRFHFANDLLGNEWLLEQDQSFSLSTLETSKINFLFLLFDYLGEDFFAADGVIGDATEFDNAFKCTLVAIIITFMLFLYASWSNKLKFWRLFSKECINSDLGWYSHGWNPAVPVKTGKLWRLNKLSIGLSYHFVQFFMAKGYEYINYSKNGLFIPIVNRQE